MPDMDTIEAKRSKTIEEWFGLCSALGFFAAFVLLGCQAFLWLKVGQWAPIPISSVLNKLNINYNLVVDISWAGVQKILIWILDLPLSLGIIAFGGLMGLLIGHLVHEISKLKNGA